MPFKIIHFFRDTSDGLGWSEVWYNQSANFDQAQTAGTSLAARRVQLLAPDNILEYMRVIGNLPVDTQERPRQQRQATLTRLNLEGQAQVAPDDSDLPWTAVKVRWTAADPGIFRTQLLRGVPDSWFDQGSDKLAAVKVANWIRGVLPTLALQQYAIRHLNPIVPPALFRVYSYTLPVTGQYEGYTRRATGRPFGLPRGRRPNRIIP